MTRWLRPHLLRIHTAAASPIVPVSRVRSAVGAGSVEGSMLAGLCPRVVSKLEEELRRIRDRDEREAKRHAQHEAWAQRSYEEGQQFNTDFLVAVRHRGDRPQRRAVQGPV